MNEEEKEKAVQEIAVAHETFALACAILERRISGRSVVGGLAAMVAQYASVQDDPLERIEEFKRAVLHGLEDIKRQNVKGQASVPASP